MLAELPDSPPRLTGAIFSVCDTGQELSDERVDCGAVLSRVALHRADNVFVDAEGNIFYGHSLCVLCVDVAMSSRPSVGQHVVQFATDFQDAQLHEAADGLFPNKNLRDGALP